MGFYLDKYWLLFILGFVLGLITFFAFIHFSSTPTKNAQKVLINESNKYPHVRPLVLNWDKNLGKTLELVPFSEKIDKVIQRNITEEKIDIASYYFRDLNNGPWFGNNLDTKYTLASLLKVPVLMSYLRLAEEDSSILHKKIKFDGVPTNMVNEKALTKPKTQLKAGQNYTVGKLLEAMIIDSDNDSFKMLVDNIDVGLLADPYNATEIEIETKDEGYKGTTRQYSAFFRVLYNSSYLTRPYSEKALQILSRSNFKAGLVAGIPEGVEVAHKFGIRELEDAYQLHDCGIVYYPEYPYLICIMSRGQDLESLASVIESLSRETYNEVHTQAARYR